MKKVDNGMRMVFIGDSLVNGACDETLLGWTGRLCQAAIAKGYILTYYNLGVRGDTTAAIFLRLRNELRWRIPKGEKCRLIFSFGINDVSLEGDQQRISTAASIENTASILKLAKTTGEVLLVSPPPVVESAMSERLKDLVNKQADFCRQKKIPFIDIFTPLFEGGSYVNGLEESDGFHPNLVGYAEIARVVEEHDAWWF